MQRKLTITIDEKVYKGLQMVIGPRRISKFLEALARPHVLGHDLENGYRAMAQDEAHEQEALEWSDALIGDVEDDPR